jgi:hypothetical protein
MGLAACFATGFIDLVAEKGIHGHRGLAHKSPVLEGQSAPPGDALGALNQFFNSLQAALGEFDLRISAPGKQCNFHTA